MVLVIISAVLYAIALIHLETFWWAIALFACPLFCVLMRTRRPFLDGFLFGLIGFGSILAGLGYALMHYFLLSKLFAVFLTWALITYFSVLCGLWFWVTKIIKDNIVSRVPNGLWQVVTTYIWFVCSFTTFFLVLDHFSLWMFDWQGFFLFDPLLALTKWKPLGDLLMVTNKVLTLLLTFLCAMVPLFLYQIRAYKMMFLFIVCMIMVHFMYPPNKAKKEESFEWLDCVGVVSIICKTNDAQLLADILYNHYETLLESQPTIRCLIIPETSILFADMRGLELAINLFYEKCNTKDVHLIFGALTEHGERSFNSCCWACAGHIRSIYYKSHAVPIVEQLPQWLSYFVSYSTLFPHDKEMLVANNVLARPHYTIENDIILVPYICSEILCNHQLSKCHDKKRIILALCNDAWTDFFYIKRLMLAAVQLKSMLLGQSILYVTHAGMVYFEA